MEKQKNYLLKIILLLVCTVSIANCVNPYCSAICAGNFGACFGPGQNDCYACAQNVFLLQRNSSGVCQLKTQHQIAFYELRNSGFNLNTYSSSQPGPVTCDQYTLSGQYVAGDYIQKTFTGIPLNHYQVVIRFSIAFIGTWNSADQTKLSVNGNTFSWTYNMCSDPQFLCNSATAANDCIKIYQQVVSHDGSNLALKFSTSIAETNPANQYWGLKDIVIITRTCHSGCVTCFGPAIADCITCAQGYFLHGNLCVQKCQFLGIVDKRICVQQCPIGYFQGQNKLCQTCQKDCLVCYSANTCSAWSDKKQGLVWEENKMFWILLIIIGLLIILYVLWKFIIKKYLKNRNMSEVHDEMKQNMVTNQNLQSTNAHKQTKKDTSSSSDSRDSQNGKDKHEEQSDANLATKNRPNSNRDVVFQQSGLQWLGEMPAMDQVIVSGYSANGQRRKKKRFRPIQEGATQSIQLNGTIESIKL